MDESQVQKITDKAQALLSALKTKIIGQDQVIREVVVALIAGGHVLVEGVPGVGKTLMAMTLAKSIGGSFSRVQFTPDLMPADIIGTTVYRHDTSEFEVRHGPVFCDVLLADEINRSPPKTQAALLEAMQERTVTIDGSPMPLPPGFFCIATQNPIEMEGTYPLPESQLDRFLMKINISYPSEGEERELLVRYREGFTATDLSEVPTVIAGPELSAIRNACNEIVVDDAVIDYTTTIVRRTRAERGVAVGASPRATVAVFLASRAWAALSGREYVIPDDIRDMAVPVLNHRILLTPEAEIEGLRPNQVIERILGTTEVPR